MDVEPSSETNGAADLGLWQAESLNLPCHDFFLEGPTVWLVEADQRVDDSPLRSALDPGYEGFVEAVGQSREAAHLAGTKQLLC
jgi:hypothetical protein